MTGGILNDGPNNVSVNYYALWNNWIYGGGTQTVTDCCFAGPPSRNATQPSSFYKGKWIRVEGVVTNRAGGPSPNGFTFKLYVQNVTDGTPEIKIVDTTIVDASVGPNNGWLGADDLTPPSLVMDFFVNNYREGQCSGYRAVSHYMVAGWNTDEGQRIGPAEEIEGGLATSICNDSDGDGWGDPASNSCTMTGRDCDDNDPDISPDAVEICDDGVDNDCDTAIDAADENCSSTEQPVVCACDDAVNTDCDAAAAGENCSGTVQPVGCACDGGSTSAGWLLALLLWRRKRLSRLFW